MSNKRITDLTELTTPTTDDVFPVVDIATNTTTKVQLGNLPTTTAVTTALATKQDTLVSGTNIKTLNSTSLLGSGNIVLTANPSGVAGAIQFSNGSAFASDAANLFWDDTNNRLGVGTNAPTRTLDVRGEVLIQYPNQQDGFLQVGTNGGGITFASGNRSDVTLKTNCVITTRGTGMTIRPTTGEPLTAMLGIIGSGSTSATTSLLVQNSAGAQAVKVFDNLRVDVRAEFRVLDSDGNNAMIMWGDGFGGTKTLWVNGNLGVGVLGNDASARLQVDSTTQGFLPPRMTTTQKNAIATPATGLMVMDITTLKLCVYNGSSWVDLH
jgi:hypothetical protein